VLADKATRQWRPRFSSAPGALSLDPTALKGHPLNSLRRIYSLLNSNSRREMSQFRVGESSNSFNNNSFNTISFNRVSNVNNLGSADEKAEILAWLSLLEPRIRHHSIRAHRVEHVGEWLLQREEYRDWFDSIHGGESDNSALFCYGGPGVGKTFIR